MRRIVRSLVVAGTLTLGACSGGGSVLTFQNNSNPDHVLVQVAAPSNIARVLPGGSLPLSAVGVNGAQNGILTGNRFRWSATLVTAASGTTYIANTLGQTRPCGGVTLTAGGVSSQLTTDVALFLTIDPTNESNVLVTPPPVLTSAALPALPVGSTLTPSYPYCVIVTAQAGTVSGTGTGTTFTPIGQPGSITVAVVNPAAPEQ